MHKKTFIYSQQILYVLYVVRTYEYVLACSIVSGTSVKHMHYKTSTYAVPIYYHPMLCVYGTCVYVGGF
jgi:hypothetical protein